MTEDLDKTQPIGGARHDDRSTLIAHSKTPDTSLLATGGRLENHYPVLEVRGGKGVTGMGVVYVVEDQGKLYAVKTFQRRFARELAFIERFVREARTWMLIGFHPNVVRAYRVEIIDAIPYLFMEYVPGDTEGRHSLAEILRQERMSIAKVLDLALQFAEGMAHAVRAVPGLAHRDIKPDNVLITPEGQLKITDFGLVRARGDDDAVLEALARSALEAKGRKQLTEMGSVFGTPAYMAPEQFEGAQKAGQPADIYAFGCCLYEMIAGRAPFRADDTPTMEKIAALRLLHIEGAPRPLREYRADCPESLIDLTMRCLAKAPEERWQSFGELAARLRQLHVEILGTPAAPQALIDAMPQEVAAQMRSISLLDGYTQAVRLKRLRERHEESPYAFHLALASYFHCQRDAAEERRQLERALESRVSELGSEAVRRLAELHLEQGRAEEALALTAPFVTAGPASADQVLEPHVRALTALGRSIEASAAIDQFSKGRRAHWLRMTLAQATGDFALLHQSGEALLGLVLQELLGSVDLCGEMGAPGYGYREDPGVLAEAIELLAPGTDTAGLAAEAVFWPDIGGMPDFSGPMAWLGEACLALGACATLEDSERARYMQAATVLGAPHRMREHLEREEYWFWLQQAAPVSERCHAGK